MNAAVYVNFLRHLLFLFIVLDLITCVLQIRQGVTVYSVFVKNRLVNFNVLPDVRLAVFRAGHLIQQMIINCCVTFIVDTLWAFIGAVYLHKYPKIIFAAGLGLICDTPMQFFMGVDMSPLRVSFGNVLMKPLQARFRAVNGISHQKLNEWLQTNDSEKLNASSLQSHKAEDTAATFAATLDDAGWVPFVNGTELDRDIIDYFQMSYKCCGFEGRLSWDLRIPSSCCSEEFERDECILSEAYKKSCVSHFNEFKNGLISVGIMCIFVAGLSIGIIVCSMILSKYKVRYPNEEYDSETSSSESENSDD